MSAIPGLPPVVEILLDEDLPLSSKPHEVKRFFKKLLPELRSQAQWTKDRYREIYRTVKHDGFGVAASGTLNPFANRGICRSSACRVRAAEHFARTVGVFADAVTIPDMISSQLTADRRLTNADLLEFANDLLVLKRIEPLLRAGIVQFRSPFVKYCEEHFQEFETRIDTAVVDLLPELESEVHATRYKDYLVVDTGRLYDPPIKNISPLTPDHQRELDRGRSVDDLGREIFQKTLRNTVRDVLFDLNAAADDRTALFSSSRLGLLSLNALEGVTPKVRDVDHWEEERAVELP